MNDNPAAAKRTRLLQIILRAYRSGSLTRGSGIIFDRLPAWLWGGPVVTIATSTGDFVLPVRERGARQLLVFGEIRHERAETAFVRRLGPRLRSAVDLGANYGWYSRLLAETMPSGAPITAVEANPALIPFLRRNLLVRVDVRQVAVVDEPGEVLLYLAECSALSSTVRRSGRRVTVPAMTVDDIVAGHVGEVDFIKCDIEGGELAALRGSRMVRAVDRAPIWLIEVNTPLLAEAGASRADLEAEFAIGGPVRYFRAMADGRLRPLLGALSGLTKGCENVVVVPERRLADLADLIEGGVRPGTGGRDDAVPSRAFGGPAVLRPGSG